MRSRLRAGFPRVIDLERRRAIAIRAQSRAVRGGQVLVNHHCACRSHARPHRLCGGASTYESDCGERLSNVSIERPSLFIFAMRVVLFRPSRAAAPFRPPTTQLVCRSVAMMCALSASASVRPMPSGSGQFVRSVTGDRSSGPVVRRTERSIKFCNSRMLPGQLYSSSTFITSSGMCTIVLPWRRANVWRK